LNIGACMSNNWVTNIDQWLIQIVTVNGQHLVNVWIESKRICVKYLGSFFFNAQTLNLKVINFKHIIREKNLVLWFAFLFKFDFLLMHIQKQSISRLLNILVKMLWTKPNKLKTTDKQATWNYLLTYNYYLSALPVENGVSKQ
jgi:hypothetical protein